MRVEVLASGSKGNCTIISGSSGSLLIDAGLSARELLGRMAAAGIDPGEVRAILVTHEHGDHIRGLDVLARKLGVPVYGTEGTLQDFFSFRRISKKPITHHACKYHERSTVEDFLIEPFATSHDAAEPCGYIVGEGDLRIGYCTDTGVVTPGMLEILRTCEGVVLESNHCPEMLKNGPYPESLKRRIRSRRGHLSNPAAAECLRGFRKDLPRIILAHLSEINNTPEKALASARDGLGLFFSEGDIIVATPGGTSAAAPQSFEL